MRVSVTVTSFCWPYESDAKDQDRRAGRVRDRVVDRAPACFRFVSAHPSGTYRPSLPRGGRVADPAHRRDRLAMNPPASLSTIASPAALRPCSTSLGDRSYPCARSGRGRQRLVARPRSASVRSGARNFVIVPRILCSSVRGKCQRRLTIRPRSGAGEVRRRCSLGRQTKMFAGVHPHRVAAAAPRRSSAARRAAAAVARSSHAQNCAGSSRLPPPADPGRDRVNLATASRSRIGCGASFGSGAIGSPTAGPRHRGSFPRGRSSRRSSTFKPTGRAFLQNRTAR